MKITKKGVLEAVGLIASILTIITFMLMIFDVQITQNRIELSFGSIHITVLFWASLLLSVIMFIILLAYRNFQRKKIRMMRENLLKSFEDTQVFLQDLLRYKDKTLNIQSGQSLIMSLYDIIDGIVEKYMMYNVATDVNIKFILPDPENSFNSFKAMIIASSNSWVFSDRIVTIDNLDDESRKSDGTYVRSIGDKENVDKSYYSAEMMVPISPGASNNLFDLLKDDSKFIDFHAISGFICVDSDSIIEVEKLSYITRELKLLSNCLYFAFEGLRNIEDTKMSMP